jgi:hypothetical protein
MISLDLAYSPLFFLFYFSFSPSFSLSLSPLSSLLHSLPPDILTFKQQLLSHSLWGEVFESGGSLPHTEGEILLDVKIHPHMTSPLSYSSCLSPFTFSVLGLLTHHLPCLLPARGLGGGGGGGVGGGRENAQVTVHLQNVRLVYKQEREREKEREREREREEEMRGKKVI